MTADELTHYLHAIAKTPLLKPAEERRLADRMVEEHRRYEEAVASGSSPCLCRRKWLDARAAFVSANLRLVVSVAKAYRTMGYPMEDLIQEGNAGLLIAVDRFQPERGTKFSTYAVWWIKQAIQRGLSNSSRLIRLPVKKVRDVVGINRGEFSLDDDEEIILRRAFVPIVSLSATGEWNYGTESKECQLADHRFREPIDEAAAGQLNGVLLRAMDELAPRSRKILLLRFGLDGHMPHTLRQIADKLGITRERVRQVQDQSLAILKRRGEKLEPFLS